jgi:hypothetical protein
MVLGPHHSMRAYTSSSAWKTVVTPRLGVLRASLTWATPPTSSERRSGRVTLGQLLLLQHVLERLGQRRDRVDGGKVNSAPALFFRTATGENDLVLQGGRNTLWYFYAPAPGSPSQAPSFTGTMIGGPSTTFGG